MTFQTDVSMPYHLHVWSVPKEDVMKRKQTLLEKNLIELGYSLSHKTYYGKNSSKVDRYVYIKDRDGLIIYSVDIDRTREHIETYSFTNKTHMQYTSGIIESLQEIMRNFECELQEIYDFQKEEAKQYCSKDEINDESIHHAEFFNIPIIVIKTNKYNFGKGENFAPKKR